MEERALYCYNCGKSTAHRLLRKEKVGSGTGLFRPLMAIATLGMSEQTLSAEYVCENCGEVKTTHD